MRRSICRSSPAFGGLDGVTGPAKSKALAQGRSRRASHDAEDACSASCSRLNNRLTGSGSAVGNLALKAGRVIDLQGLGDQFSGLYRITSATHTIDGGGFKTSFDARKEVWFGSIPIPRGIGGLARVNGQRIG